MGRYRDAIVLTDNLGFEQDYPNVKEAAHAAVTWYQEFYKSIEGDSYLPQDVLPEVLAVINWFDPNKINTAPELDSYLNGVKHKLIKLLAPAWGVSIKQAAEEGWLVVHPTTLGHWSASTKTGTTMRFRRVADRLSDAIEMTESKMRRVETLAATNLKGALGSLASYLELLNLQPEQLKDAAENEDIMMELIMDDELLRRLAGFADKLHTFTANAAQAAGDFVGVHEDLMELQDMWQERKEKEREMARLPGAPEARDYQQVQSRVQRRRRLR